jgi:hypothetical protein
MSSISVQNFSSIDDDYKEISLSKETDFKTKTETLDAWIFLNTYPNEMVTDSFGNRNFMQLMGRLNMHS